MYYNNVCISFDITETQDFNQCTNSTERLSQRLVEIQQRDSDVMLLPCQTQSNRIFIGAEVQCLN